jgi:uncharacterized membrane protein
LVEGWIGDGPISLSIDQAIAGRPIRQGATEQTGIRRRLPLRADVPPLLPVHIAAGGLAIILGFTALAVRKGGLTHRRVGMAFVYAMLVMGISASVIAFRKDPNDGNVTAGLLSAYFVVTAFTAVRPASAGMTWLTAGASLVAAVLSLRMFVGGVIAWQAPGHMLNGVPALMMFFLGSVLALAAFGDVRVIRSGRLTPLTGRPRLARHLWRMCFAFFIAAGSFFSIRARVATVLPDAINVLPLRLAMILLPFAAMFYWLWRIRTRRPLPTRLSR